MKRLEQVKKEIEKAFLEVYPKEYPFDVYYEMENLYKIGVNEDYWTIWINTDPPIKLDECFQKIADVANAIDVIAERYDMEPDQSGFVFTWYSMTYKPKS